MNQVKKNIGSPYWKNTGTILVVVLLGLALCAGIVVSAPSAPGETTRGSGRFGFGLTTSANEAHSRGLPSYIRAGWYWDWAARGASQLPPLEYAQTIRLSPVKSNGVQIGYTARPTGTALLSAIANQPGAIWLIGNEPDCDAMDNMRSEFYAEAYYNLYHIIKAADPMAQVAAGNIVQPTEMRFMYLDRILGIYEERYGEPLPADLWSIHSYILCERCYPYKAPGEPFAWGACLVPDWSSWGNTYDFTTFYSVYDHWDVEIFKSRIVDFRQWMYDNGYRNHPLVIPEYGILFYDGLVKDMQPEDDVVFMNETFDWMREARDPVLGYGPDDNRLVQRWAWYSLAHRFPGGSLFNDSSLQPTYLGNAYRDYTEQFTPTAELSVFNVVGAETSAPDDPKMTILLTTTLANPGDLAVDEDVALSCYVGETLLATRAQALFAPLGCCGGHQEIALSCPEIPRSATTSLRVVAETASGSLDASRAFSLSVDLAVSRVWSPIVREEITQPITVTLYADVTNTGGLGTGEPVTVTFYHAQTVVTPIGETTVASLPCCGAEARAAIQWPNRTSGLYPICATAAIKSVTSDLVCGYLWIDPPYELFMPLILR